MDGFVLAVELELVVLDAADVGQKVEKLGRRS